MRWRKEIYEAPAVGGRRVHGRFAWWPITLDDGWRVWLEWYDVAQEYGESTIDYSPCGHEIRGWCWRDVRTSAPELTLADHL